MANLYNVRDDIYNYMNFKRKGFRTVFLLGFLVLGLGLAASNSLNLDGWSDQPSNYNGGGDL